MVMTLALEVPTVAPESAPVIGSVADIRICGTLADLAPLSGDWTELERTAAGSTVFTSYAWAQHVLTSSVANGDAIIATVRANGRLLALWPLALRRHRGATVLTGIGAPFDQYADALIAPGSDSDELISAMIAALRKAAVADGIVLRKAKVSGQLYRYFRTRAAIVCDGSEAPYITLDPSAPVADFLATVNAKTRKNLRNYANRQARLGNVTHAVFKGRDAAWILSECHDVRRAWLMDNGLSSEAFRDPRLRDFVKDVGASGDRIGLVGFALSVDGEPAALQWGFVHEGSYYAFMSCRNPKFESFSVGRIHLQQVIECCHTLGCHRIDLMVPAVAYKLNWTKSTEAVVDLIVPWSMRGVLMLTFIEQTLRPLAKRAVAGLPRRLRAALLKIINR